MKTMKTVILMSGFIFAFVFLTANYTQAQDAKPWNIPAKYKAMKSTVKAGDKDALADGKMLWAKYCKSCHGKDGLGDGPKARMLKTFPGDFSTAAFQKQSDGEMYYKSFVGRDEMPNYEKKITSEADRWALVAYMRTMGK
jgi:mono/diheme cytochrome c family protein